MVGMWVVLIAVALVVVGAVLVMLYRRPKGDDLNSVRSYHSALGTLEHLSDRTGRSTVDVAGSPESPGEAPSGPRYYRRPGTGGDAPADRGTQTPGAAATGGVGRAAGEGGATGTAGAATVGGPDRSVPPVPVRGNEEFPDPGAPLVFDDSRPRDRIRRATSGDGSPAPRADRAQRHALHSMNRRPRRGTAVMVVVVVLLLFGALAFIGSRRSSRTGSSHPSTTAAAGHSGTTTPTSSGSGHRRRPSKVKKVETPPTTLPSQIIATSSTSTTANFPVSASSYQLVITASGPCWVDVTSDSSGSTLWTGTLQAGGVQAIQGSGTVNVELGSPTVSLTVDKVPVVFPTPMHSPFIATFAPGAATSTPTGATTTTPPTTTTAQTG